MGEEIHFENGRISNFQGLDLDLGSGHTAYQRASLINLYLHSKFHSNWKNFLRTDERTYVQTEIETGFIRLTRVVVELNIKSSNTFDG